MLVVFDLDGTLSSNAHRTPMVHHQAPGHEAWLENEVRIDPPNTALVWLFRTLVANDVDVRVWTARPERYMPQTAEWLQRHGCYATEIRMAPNDWRGTDLEVKRRWAKECPPDLVFEDSSDICAMYAEAGAHVVHVKPWW